MSSIFTDDFNRANAASLGADWTDVNGGWSISSNQATPDTASDCFSVVTGAGWTGGAATTDQYCQVKLVSIGTREAGPICRASSSAMTGYLWSVSTTGASATHQLQRAVAGVFTALSPTASFTVAANDVIRVEAQGTTIRAVQNGVTKITVTSESSISAGRPGLYAFRTSPIVDDLDAGDFSGGGGGSSILRQMLMQH